MAPTTGSSIGIAEVIEAKRQSDIVKEFMLKYPEYYSCPENSELLVTQGQKIDEKFTLELLEKVYQEWKEFLTPRPTPMVSSYTALDVDGSTMAMPVFPASSTTYGPDVVQVAKPSGGLNNESESGYYAPDVIQKLKEALPEYLQQIPDFNPFLYADKIAEAAQGYGFIPTPKANFIITNIKTGPEKIEPPKAVEYDAPILETHTTRRIKNDE